MKDFNDNSLKRLLDNRVTFPKKAVVTAGMPYGNKLLHCGHISTMIHADMFARFLRDRLGPENVMFVSGTDAYGSPILESYRKLVEEKNYTGTLEEFVTENYNAQKQTLLDYQISTNFYGSSAFGEAKEIHEKTSAEIFNTLKKYGYLKKLSSLQFYDSEKQTLLNGRQVIGKCPFENCASLRAYADECELGHQYMPEQLLNPISSLSNTTPILKSVGNWYFNLDKQVDLLKDWINYLKNKTTTRSYVIKEISEFLKKPEIYIKQEFLDLFNTIKNHLPPFILNDENKNSFTIQFNELLDREKACEILSQNSIQYRTGKTLVPFRLTGNISWGVPAPDTNELKNQTFWVWPESLWAPISFTKTSLLLQNKDISDWKNFWCSKDAIVYQFIGEDNIYFYGAAQNGIWLALQGENPTIDTKDGDLSITMMVANKHTLFLGKKASSSSDIQPPLAHELLNYYTPEQLRFHLLGMNVGNNNANFMPKPFNPNTSEKEADPVLKEGNLLTNVYNRALRTLFYAWQKDFDSIMPYGEVEENILINANKTILKYEKLMYEQKFHMVVYELDSYIRNLNKYLSKNLKNTNCAEDKEKNKQVLINGLHMAKIALVLLHPITPDNCQYVCECLGASKNIFNWQNIDKPIYHFIKNANEHKPLFIEPRFDFFKKHPTQIINL